MEHAMHQLRATPFAREPVDHAAPCRWQHLRALAAVESEREAVLRHCLETHILCHATIAGALAELAAQSLANPWLDARGIRDIAMRAYERNPEIAETALDDLGAIVERDAAVVSPLYPFLFFRGYRALQCYRLAHWLWNRERTGLALCLQSRIVETFSVDIHPAARIGRRVMLDHGTGIVIGETAVIDDDVSVLHGVTLGGTGKEARDRHPKVRKGVLIGAGAKILGNVEIGEGAKIASGSVVLKPVPPHTTVAGIPAKAVERPQTAWPALDMCQTIAHAEEHCSTSPRAMLET
ncbi:MAG: serine O-acetyltransferase [Burkholderiales bacterium]